MQQLCVQLPTSADNVTLLVYAADRCAAVRRCLLQKSIDIACPWGQQQQTCGTLLQRLIDGTDRQTYGHRTVAWTVLHTSA